MKITIKLKILTTLTSTNKKVLCDMALPTQKLPEKSFTTVQVQRKLPAVRPFVEVDPLISLSVSHASEYYYKDLDELYSDFHQNRKWMGEWCIEHSSEEEIKLFLTDSQHLVPYAEIFVDSKLEFTVFIRGFQKTLLSSY